MRAGAALRLAAVTVAVLLAGCGGGPEDSRSKPARPIVLVSGRDDHGLLVTPTVGVSEEPDPYTTPRMRVANGTLAAVVGSRGEWIRIRTLEGRSRTGWVNDFYLRGTAHLVGGEPGCPVAASESPGAKATFRLPASAQVELLELRRDDGRAWVRVRSVETRDEAWVERKTVSELPDRRRRDAAHLRGAPCPI